MQKVVPNKRYTLEFKKQVREMMRADGLIYSEVTRQFDVSSHTRIMFGKASGRRFNRRKSEDVSGE